MTLCVYHVPHAAISAREPRPGWYVADSGDPVAGPFGDKDTARDAMAAIAVARLEREEA